MSRYYCKDCNCTLDDGFEDTPDDDFYVKCPKCQDRLYYSFNQIDKLFTSILEKRDWVKKNYYPDYKAAMEKAKIENQNNLGFWRKAVVV